ncbi:hypothetical protein V6N13_121685 [Hibiscus sabdariffa]|uniref:Uncharacterized protein n=2 Tax=Hibiscus sabdariffa TaxID=183260 RepID=A0ABR2AYD8_9ROSI
MKAFLFILCLVLASTLSFPTSTIARELAETVQNPRNPTNPAVNCGRGLPYSACMPKSPPKCAGVYSRGGCSDDSTP